MQCALHKNTLANVCVNFFIHDFGQTYIGQLHKYENITRTDIPNEYILNRRLLCFIAFKRDKRSNFYIGLNDKNGDELICSRARYPGTNIFFFRQGCSMSEQGFYENGTKPFDGFHCADSYKTGVNCSIGNI